MAKRLFGTDGIRGVAGKFPLDAATAYALGAELGAWARGVNAEPEVLIGMDTRESGPWLAEHVAGGLARSGVRTRFAGVITTPGLAYLTRRENFVAGVMISASHNPYRDNGIKVFDHSGYKLPDEREAAIETGVFALLEETLDTRPETLAVDEGLDLAYVDFLASTVKERFDGLTVVLDCGNGAASHLAPLLMERLGARVYSIGTCPNGRNINLGCGALHPEGLQRQVLAHGAALGIAFDGDADRAIFVSSSGRRVDGDGVLFVLGGALLANGQLPGNTVVATVMSNLGLERAFDSMGIRMLRAPVGDKYVLEEMLRTGATLGGEQSGHLILREYATTGDGMLTGLKVLELMVSKKAGLDELIADLQVFPQLTLNVSVVRRKPLEHMERVREAIAEAERAFDGSGRVLVRFSGTEPLCRVMVEGREAEQVRLWADRIASSVSAELS